MHALRPRARLFIVFAAIGVVSGAIGALSANDASLRGERERRWADLAGPSADAARFSGKKVAGLPYKELIHRDNLVVIGK